MRTVTVRLTDKAYEKLRAAAFKTHTTQNEILASGMEMWIEHYADERPGGADESDN